MARIFLSHLRDDGALARRLAEALRRAGHEPLLVEEEMSVGDSALTVLERSLRDADVGVLCLSRAALADAWMQTEFQTVLSQLEVREKPLLVARFDWVIPQGRVAQKPAVDLFPEVSGWEAGLSTLLEVLRQVDEEGLTKVWPLLLGAPPVPAAFVDREEVLRQLHETLAPHSGHGGVRRAVLLGPGGIGKTAIALRFAHDSAESFPGGIWWCDEPGRTPDEALARFFWKIRLWAPLAVRAPLDPLGPDAPTEELAGAVRQVLEGVRQPTLLIIHDTAELAWDGHLPGPPVSILMMRQESEGAVGKQMPVEPLPVSAALQLIDALTVLPEGSQELEARFKIVSELAGGSPLALTLVAHAHRRGLRWSQIEQAWRSRTQETGSPWAGERQAPILDAVFSLLTPSMLWLLETVAIFAFAPVPADWIGALVKDDTERRELDDAVRELLTLGLFTWNAEERTLFLHPLFHYWGRKQIKASKREEFLRRNLGVMESWLRPSIPLLRPEQVAELEVYVPHFLETLEATRLHLPSETWIRLAVEVSTILKFRSEYPMTLEWLERALSQANLLQSPLHQLNCLVELATTLYSIGWEQRADPYVQQAVALASGLPSKPEPDFINGLYKLAVLLRKKDPGHARRLAEQAVQLAESILGVDNEKTAILLSNLAVTTEMAEGAAAAIPLFQRALEIIERRLGEESTYVAQVSSGLALALAHVGDLAGARKLMEKAVAIDGRVLPSDHPEVAERLRGLAVILMEMGEFASAKPLLDRALDIEERKLGPEHPVLSYTLHNLGSALLNLGKVQEAEEVLLKAAALEEKGLSPDDPLLANTRMALAMAAGRRGDRRAAGLHLERALDAGMALYAPESGPGQEPLEKALRLARGRQVNPEAYVTALLETVELAEREGDTTNATKAALLLGAFEGRRGAWEVARRHIERGLRLAKQANAAMLVAESHRLLGDASLHGSRYEDARLHYAEAIRRLGELGLSVRAARVRMLLVVMMLQLSRTEGLLEHASALEAVLKEGRFTQPAERSEVEQLLRLVDAARRGVPPEPQGNTE